MYTSGINSTVSPGSYTSFFVIFNPSTNGGKSAVITIVNNSSGISAYTITLTGTATAVPKPEISIRQGTTGISSGGSLNFGSLISGSSGTPVTFTIENTGSADMFLAGISLVYGDITQFSLDTTGMIGTINPGGSATFTVTFTPTSPGSKSAILAVTDNDSDEGTYLITLMGTATAVPEPEINVKQGSESISPGGSKNFGSIASNLTGPPVTFIVENTGTAGLAITGVALTSGDASQFSLDTAGMSGTVNAGGNTAFNVTFKPTSIGQKTAVLTITNSDTDKGTYTMTLTGISTLSEIQVKQGASDIDSGGSRDFGRISTGTSGPPVVFTIFNNGTTDLEISRVSLTSGDTSQFLFDTSVMNSTVIPGGNTSFTVVYSPTGFGDKTAVLTIVNNDSDEGNYVINLTGRVNEQEINVTQGTDIGSGGSKDFGSVSSGSSGTPVVFTIENKGTADLSISGVSLTSGDTSQFSIDTTGMGSIVAPGGNTTFSVTFSPNEIGSKSAVLTILNSDTNEGTYTINLTGTSLRVVPVTASFSPANGETDILNYLDVKITFSDDMDENNAWSVTVDGTAFDKNSPEASWAGKVLSLYNISHIFSYGKSITVSLSGFTALSDGASLTGTGTFSFETLFVYPVADTGQTQCSSLANGLGAMASCPQAVTGQDGDYADKPNARSFTDPTQHSSYTSDYTTKDNVTGLIWKTCSEGQTDSSCVGTALAYTWNNAIPACTALNSANSGNGYSGRADWRLPSYYELSTIVNHGLYNPSIDMSFFPGTLTLPNVYWTSNTCVFNTSNAWYADFYWGSMRNGGKASPYYVRCVSGP